MRGGRGGEQGRRAEGAQLEKEILPPKKKKYYQGLKKKYYHQGIYAHIGL